MMLDLKDENKDTLLSIQAFHWPQHSFLIEHFRGQKISINSSLCFLLKDLGIFTEKEASEKIKSKIAVAAKISGQAAKNRVWFSFDIFLSRNRPGLITDPDNPCTGKKKKRKRKNKKKGKDDNNNNSTTVDTDKKCLNLDVLAPTTNYTDMRGI